jgi:hypothetical protein
VLTKFSIDGTDGPCEIHGVSSPAIPPEEAFEGQLLNAEKSSIAPIPFPAFDENRRLIVEWVEGLNYGRNKALLPSMAATLPL